MAVDIRGEEVEGPGSRASAFPPSFPCSENSDGPRSGSGSV